MKRKVEVSLTQEQWEHLCAISRATGQGRDMVIVMAIEALYEMEQAQQQNGSAAFHEPTSDQ